jgi:hypothetical protein
MNIPYVRDEKTDSMRVESVDPMVTKLFIPNEEEKSMISET